MSNESVGIKEYQKSAGKLLNQIRKISGVSSFIFCDTLSQFLENIEVPTVQGYFSKVTVKYLIPEDGYATFRSAIIDTINELIENHPWGEKGGKILADNWEQLGKPILIRLDEVHKSALALDCQTNLQEIDDFLTK